MGGDGGDCRLMPVSAGDINGSPDAFSGRSNVGVRVWILFAFVLGIGSVMTGMALMITQYTQRTDHKDPTTTWPGIAMFAQSVIIFLAAMLYRFGGDAMDTADYDAF